MLNQALSKSNFGKSNSLSEQSVAESKLNNFCSLSTIEELSEEESAMVMGGGLLNLAVLNLEARFDRRIARAIGHLG